EAHFFDVSPTPALLGLGATIENIFIAAEHDGFVGSYMYTEKDGDLTITITFKESPLGSTSLTNELYSSIAVRQTDRRPYRDQKVPDEIYTKMLASPSLQGITFTILRDELKNHAAPVLSRYEATRIKIPILQRSIITNTRYGDVQNMSDGLPLVLLGLG